MRGLSYATKPGFTIVELLIVIVVIAILAAITVVAYTGVQSQAYDSTVQSDLAGIAKKLEIEKIKSSTGTYPAANNPSLDVLNVHIAASAYATGTLQHAT